MLEPDFRFSQHSLGDFEDCPRRFYLRYVARQAWPLVETGPHGMDALTYREYLRRGATLHRWIERFWLSPPASALDLPPPPDPASDPELAVWWARFLATDFGDLPAERLPELELSAPLGEHRLYARFDLLAIDNQESGQHRLVVVDWKTLRGDQPPSLDFLRRRLQTRVYLYVLATAGAPFNGGDPVAPERCAMRYWLANFPEQPWAEIGYTRAEYEADRAQLLALAADAARRTGEAEFEKTDDERKCTYCIFRTLCHRRGANGAAPPDDEEEINLSGDAQTLDY